MTLSGIAPFRSCLGTGPATQYLSYLLALFCWRHGLGPGREFVWVVTLLKQSIRIERNAAKSFVAVKLVKIQGVECRQPFEITIDSIDSVDSVAIR